MRAIRFLIATAIAGVVGVAGCGDNQNKPDAAPDSPTQPGCNDGIDNDGDGKVDWPNDPGCLNKNQEDETDDCPSGPHCPQCGNGVDDDDNGATDYPSDPGCESAADPSEFVNNPVACGPGLTIKPVPSTGTDSGTLDGASFSNLPSDCGGGQGSPAIAYQISLPAPKVLVATTDGSSIDTVLDLRNTACTTADIECNDNISTSNKSSKITRSLLAGNYYLIVEGRDSATVGAYTVDVRLFTGEGEACTDTSQCGPGLLCRIPLNQTAMVCSKPMCSDGVDDDGDGKLDFPTDPGCQNAADNDETDPNPEPACSNGADDDLDGMTDYPMDTSCNSASGNSEACQGEQDPVNAIIGPTTSGTLVGAHDNHNPTCGGDGGGDILYTLTIPPLRSLVVDTEGTTGDTLLSLMTAMCTEPSLACDNDGGTSGLSSRLQFTNLAAGTYIVAVDNYDGTKAPAPYDLHVTGVIEQGGSCAPADTLGGALACPAPNPCGPGPGGTMICLPSICNDGIDNDGDGKMDYPADPGCTSVDDTDESDSCPGAGPNCPECADGVDNDGDGQMDYPNDLSCSAPSSQSEGCATTDGIVALTQPVTTDTTVGLHDDVHPPGVSGCASATNTAPDRTFSLQLPALKNLSILGNNLFNGTLVLYNSTCAGTPLACSDPETISRTNVAAGNYFLVVDGNSTESGAFTLTVSGTIQNGASCEAPLAQSGALVCANGFTCGGTPGARTCRPSACSDGVDNDGDGVADYPNDPGCASPSDADEADNCPGGAGCPACSDGIDNDGDLQIDYPADPGCASASSTAEGCSTSENVTPLVMPLTSDTTFGAVNDDTPSCSAASNAPDKVYSLTVPALVSLSVRTTASGFTAATSLYDATCGGTSLACTTTQPLTKTALAAGTYYFSVDGTTTTSGTYSISVSGNIAGGQSCESPLAVAGALICDTGYACRGTIGSRTCQPTLCNDGMDNDGDGKMDYPADPGCTSISDDDETDDCPNGPNCPVCGDGVDNDNDGLTDYPMDTACAAASSNNESCATTEPVTPLTAAVTMGTTVGATNDFAPSCGGTNTAGDQIYSLSLPAMTSLKISNSNSFDAAVALYDASCGGTALACKDEPEDLSVGPLAAGTYYYLVDGYSSGTGTYTITLSGNLAGGESCEGPLALAGAFTCSPGFTCKGTAGMRTCQAAACYDGIDNDGDGKIDFPFDPGCASPSDEDEANPATLPVCSNGTDDDTDSATDFPADTGCANAAGTSEAFCAAEADPIMTITAATTTGTTSGAANSFASTSCQSNASGPDVTFLLQVPVVLDTLVLDLSTSSFDTVLTLRDPQCAAEVACDDDSGDPGTQSKAILQNVIPGNYAVVVDGYSGANGAFTLNVKGTAHVGSSCSSPLFASGVLACQTGTTCTGTPMKCQ